MENNVILDKEADKEMYGCEDISRFKSDSLTKFNDLKFVDVKHGLNIATELQFINNMVNSIQINNINNSKEDKKTLNIKIIEDTNNTITYKQLINNKKIKNISLKEFLDSLEYTEEYKKEIITRITEKHSNNQLNKLDYLHQITANIQLVIFNKGYFSEEIIMIEKILEEHNNSHIIIIIPEESKVNIYFKTINSIKKLENNNNTPNNNDLKIITDFTDVIISKNSDVTLIEHRQLSTNDIIYGKKNIVIENDCKVNWITIDKDSKLTFIKNIAELKGDNSNIIMNNIVCGKNSKYTIYNTSEHIGTNTKSLIQNRCVLKNSKAIVKGLVKIDTKANNSNGYQKSDMILMDDTSQGISLPDLEIHNDQVKCSHGSSITQIDEEKLFYLESRGIDKNNAEKLLIEGFYDIILAHIPSDTLRKSIREEVLE
ncbi:MAG: SufD family Fe-S cluster assembly protein [Candidatus Woesearchaeota archaeon]